MDSGASVGQQKCLAIASSELTARSAMSNLARPKLPEHHGRQ